MEKGNHPEIILVTRQGEEISITNNLPIEVDRYILFKPTKKPIGLTSSLFLFLIKLKKMPLFAEKRVVKSAEMEN